MNGDVIVIKLK